MYSVGVGVCRNEVEDNVNKLRKEVESLSRSEQNAAKSQAVEKEQVTFKCAPLTT